ncbi:MAG: ATP-binding protein [Clostridiales Family XIII bacterium]|jgi:AAA+ ATPase superfamily predicted ATPase|nr:ATP-binding protein [Clostridiales Family XIII bacterium]
MVLQNPFTPAFGSEPLFLAGREQIIEDILRGLENGPGDPNRATILIGPRGSGKTVLLTKIANEAGKANWISARVTASEGMLDSILEQTQKNGKEFLPAKAKTRLKEMHAFGIGFSIEAKTEKTPSWRFRMAEIMELLAEYRIGLLITVDEIDVRHDELISLVRDFQHFVTEKREVALLMAGLPGKTLQMFQDKNISFVRRAFQHQLNAIPISDVTSALKKTIMATGRTIDDDALETAANYSRGFPFLIQLVGYHMWRQSPDKKNIKYNDAVSGIDSAGEYMDRMILDTTVKDLSEKDLLFLIAMLPDADESRMSSIANRMNVTAATASQYRLRLIRQGVIEEYGRGKVQFSMPLLREYLQKHYL